MYDTYCTVDNFALTAVVVMPNTERQYSQFQIQYSTSLSYSLKTIKNRYRTEYALDD